MKIRHNQKAEDLILDFHFLLILHRNRTEIPIYNLFKKADGTARCNDLYLRAIDQQVLYAACVIRLRMINDQIINLRYVNHFF